MANRVSDDEVALWYCEHCRKSGALHVSGADFYSVIRELSAAHKDESPECDTSTAFVRIARPNSWYADLIAEVRRHG